MLAFAIDLFDQAHLRVSRHEVGGFDLEIGGTECDLRGARGLRADQADVPVGDRIGELPGGLVGDKLQRHLEPRGDLTRHVGGYALRIAVRRTPRDEQEVRQIDPCAQYAVWRKLRDHGRVGVDSHCSDSRIVVLDHLVRAGRRPRALQGGLIMHDDGPVVDDRQALDSNAAKT